MKTKRPNPAGTPASEEPIQVIAGGTLNAPPPERWMQQLWRHQRLRRNSLRLTNGQPLRILHPGFWNREAGPDFRGAIVQIGDAPPLSGDIEVDRHPTAWFQHGHARNPAYRAVVLHVVWNTAPSHPELPTLALEPHLDGPLADLVPWLEDGSLTAIPPGTQGRCYPSLQGLTQEALADLLTRSARKRLEQKTRFHRIRARLTDWDQALWESLFTALGFQHNRWPLQRLAEIVTGEPFGDPRAWEARLFGLSGLLPVDPPSTVEAVRLFRELWDTWWRERGRWSDDILPRTVWRFAGIRPANHPQRRLALAARWRSDEHLPQRLRDWLARCASEDRPPGVLLRRALEQDLPSDSFWNRHWTLRSEPQSLHLPWFGESRTTDIAMNSVLPWLRAQAEAADDAGAVRRIDALYFQWPTGQDNGRLRRIRQRLFSLTRPRLPQGAAIQQGLLQIAEAFCEPGGSLCESCRFPELIPPS